MVRMKKGLVICTLAVLAASCVADSSKDSNVPQEIAGLADIMKGMVEPSAETIWNSVSFTADQSGSRQNSPQSDEDWQRVRNAALLIGESMNLTVSSSRQAGHKLEKNPALVEAGTLSPADIQKLISSNPTDFAKHARSTQLTALQVIEAVDAKDAKALEAAGAELDKACEACHVQYWYPPK